MDNHPTVYTDPRQVIAIAGAMRTSAARGGVYVDVAGIPGLSLNSWGYARDTLDLAPDGTARNGPIAPASFCVNWSRPSANTPAPTPPELDA